MADGDNTDYGPDNAREDAYDKIRRNALAVARRAEAAGIAMLTLHGRTRADFYHGVAEYDTIAEVKAALSIPVVANGDIDSPHKARAVLAHTGADAVMIGRAAQGRPWIFRETVQFLATGTLPLPPTIGEARRVFAEHLADHHAFHGPFVGVRTARKHIGWMVRDLPGGEAFRQHMNMIADCALQRAALDDWISGLGADHETLPAPAAHPSQEPERLAA